MTPPAKGGREASAGKCRSWRKKVVLEPGGGGEVKAGGTPHLRGSSFTGRRHFRHCRQCTERSPLRGAPGRADPWWHWWVE